MYSIKHQGAKGVNYVEDILPLNVSPCSSNVDTQRGLWAKRKGENSLITSLGDNPVHSLHSGKTATGDKLIAGYLTSLYSLTGSDDTITKTTTADFEAGTFTDAGAVDDSVVMPATYIDDDCSVAPSGDVYDTITNVLSDGSKYYLDGNNGVLEKTFDLESDNIEIDLKDITISAGVSDRGYLKCEVCDSSDDRVFMIYVYDNLSSYAWTYVSFYDDSSEVYNSRPNATVDTKVTLNNGNLEFFLDGVSVATSSTTKKIKKIKITFHAYEGAGGIYLGDINIKTGNETTGEYESQILDLAQTPSACTLDYNTTTSGSQSVFMYVAGSEDGINFNEYSLASNGGNLPYRRYLKIKAVLESNNYYTTPSLDDYTISYTTNADTTTEIDTGLTGNIVRFMNYDSRTYYTFGDYPKYWDGTNVKVLGNSNIPSSVPTLTAGSTGVLSGTYYYKVTYVDSDGVEGNPSDASGSVTVTNKEIDLTDIPTLAGYNRRLYRTIADGSVYYFVDEIEDDTTTTYTDNISDDTIEVSSGLVQTDNYAPPKSDLIYQHKNYFFYVDATDNSILWFSKVYGTSYDHPLGAFEQVPLTNFKKLPNDIKALQTFDNKLLVSGEGFTGFFYGDIFGGDSDNTTWYPVDDIGAINAEGIAICQSNSGALCVMFTETGIRYLVTGEYETALQRLPLSHPIQKYVNCWCTNGGGLMFFESRLYISFTYYEDTPVDYQNTVFVYDFIRNVWDGPWDIKTASAAIYNNHFYCGDSRVGKVYEMWTGSSDAGENIHMICDLVGNTDRYKSTIQKIKVQATTDSVTDDLYIKMDIDENNKIMATGANSTWRKTASNYSQDLMEKRLWVKKRGSFYNLRIEDDSTNPIEIKSIDVEFEGVKE